MVPTSTNSYENQLRYFGAASGATRCLGKLGVEVTAGARLVAAAAEAAGALGAVALAAAAGTTVAAGRALVRHGAGGGAGGLLQRVGDDIRREVEVLDALVGEVPVVVPPGELLLDELLGGEGLHQLDHLKVGDLLDLGVSGEVEVLLGVDDALTEEVLVHLLAVLLGNKHVVLCCLSTTTARLEG